MRWRNWSPENARWRENASATTNLISEDISGGTGDARVLIVEALAQTGAVAILSMEENRGKTAYFAEINRARFKKVDFQGDADPDTEIIRQKGPIGIGSATASRAGRLSARRSLRLQSAQGGVEEKMAALFQKRKKEPAEKKSTGGDDCVPGLRQEINKKEAEKKSVTMSAMNVAVISGCAQKPHPHDGGCGTFPRGLRIGGGESLGVQDMRTK